MAQQTNRKARPAEGSFPQYGLRFTSFTQKAITELILAAKLGVIPPQWTPATIALRIQIPGTKDEETHWLDTASAAQVVMAIVRPIVFVVTDTALELQLVGKTVASWRLDEALPANEKWVLDVAKERGVPEVRMLVMASKAETVEEATPDRKVKLLIEVPSESPNGGEKVTEG